MLVNDGEETREEGGSKKKEKDLCEVTGVTIAITPGELTGEAKDVVMVALEQGDD